MTQCKRTWIFLPLHIWIGCADKIALSLAFLHSRRITQIKQANPSTTTSLQQLLNYQIESDEIKGFFLIYSIVVQVIISVFHFTEAVRSLKDSPAMKRAWDQGCGSTIFDSRTFRDQVNEYVKFLFHDYPSICAKYLYFISAFSDFGRIWDLKWSEFLLYIYDNLTYI